MGAIGQELGEVLQSVEQGSAQHLTEELRDNCQVSATVEQAGEVLQKIESSVAEASKRIATDPDFPDKVVHLRKRELEHYGLTLKDIRVLSLKVQQLSSDLELHKQRLALANLRHEDHDSPDQFSSKAELQQREREIFELRQKLEKLTTALEKLDTAESPNQRSLSIVRVRRRREESSDRSSITSPSPPAPVQEHKKEVFQRDAARQAPYNRTLQQDDEWVREHPKREGQTILEGERLKNIAGGGDALRTNTERIDTSPPTRRIPLRLNAFQARGQFTTLPTRKLAMIGNDTMLLPMHIAQEELVQTLDYRRSHKQLSVQAQYSRLVAPFQGFLGNWIWDLKKQTGLEWTIASIDLRKKRSLLGRTQYEQIQIIMQSRSREPKSAGIPAGSGPGTNPDASRKQRKSKSPSHPYTKATDRSVEYGSQFSESSGRDVRPIAKRSANNELNGSCDDAWVWSMIFSKWDDIPDDSEEEEDESDDMMNDDLVLDDALDDSKWDDVPDDSEEEEIGFDDMDGQVMSDDAVAFINTDYKTLIDS